MAPQSALGSSACFHLLLLRQARHVNFLFSSSKFAMTTTWSPEVAVSLHSSFETPVSALGSSACFHLLLLRQARHVNFLSSSSKFVMTTTWSPEVAVSLHSSFETPVSALFLKRASVFKACENEINV